MIKEEKEILYKDLCARLPYGVSVSILEYNDYEAIEKLDAYWMERFYNPAYDIKPYLFPPQSLPQELKEEICKVADGIYTAEGWDAMIEVIDLMNKYKVDYRGLIPMGLAKDATGLNIYGNETWEV